MVRPRIWPRISPCDLCYIGWPSVHLWKVKKQDGCMSWGNLWGIVIMDVWIFSHQYFPTSRQFGNWMLPSCSNCLLTAEYVKLATLNYIPTSVIINNGWKEEVQERKEMKIWQSTFILKVEQLFMLVTWKILNVSSTLIWYNNGRVRTYHGLFVLCKYFYWKENIRECLCSE